MSVCWCKRRAEPKISRLYKCKNYADLVQVAFETARCGFFQSRLRNGEVNIEALGKWIDQINCCWVVGEQEDTKGARVNQQPHWHRNVPLVGRSILTFFHCKGPTWMHSCKETLAVQMSMQKLQSCHMQHAYAANNANPLFIWSLIIISALSPLPRSTLIG